MGQAVSQQTRPLSVVVASWNLGNAAPPDDLHPWLPPSAAHTDIIVIGVQEAVYEPRPGFPNCEIDWFMRVHQAVGEDAFVCVKEQSLSPRTDQTYKSETAFLAAVKAGKASISGIRISVYVRKELRPFVKDVEGNWQTCGRLNGMSGNKGGVSCSFRIGGTRLCFIACHLAAHLEELERRNQDYQVICSGLHPTRLGLEPDEATVAAAADESSAADNLRDIEVPNRNEVVFFFGDLNYRLAPPLALEEAMTAEVVECIKDRDWPLLVSFDQLLNEQKTGRIFTGYKEAAIQFAPTFKFNPLSAKNPTLTYSLKRCPSYCDRVLWKTTPGVNVTCQEYKSWQHEFHHSSDHMPISASFVVPVTVFRDMSSLDAARAPGAADDDDDDDGDDDDDADDDDDDADADPVTGAGLVVTPTVVLSHLVWEKHAQFIKSEVEPGSGIIVRVTHQLAAEGVRTEPAPFAAPTWGASVHLAAPGHSELACRRYPLLFAVRNHDTVESGLHKLGEGMLNLNNLDRTGTFTVALTQFGLPFGKLTGRVQLQTTADL